MGLVKKDIFSNVFQEGDLSVFDYSSVDLSELDENTFVTVAQYFGNNYGADGRMSRDGFSIITPREPRMLFGMYRRKKLEDLSWDIVAGADVEELAIKYGMAKVTIRKYAWRFNEACKKRGKDINISDSLLTTPDGRIGRWNYGMRKLNVESVKQMRELYICGIMSQRELSEMFCVAKATVSAIVSRGSTVWKDAWMNKESHVEQRDWYKNNPIGDMNDWQFISM